MPSGRDRERYQGVNTTGATSYPAYIITCGLRPISDGSRPISDGSRPVSDKREVDQYGWCQIFEMKLSIP